MTQQAIIDLSLSEFIRPAFDAQPAKFIIVRAGRRAGKTYAAVQKAILYAASKADCKILWVDTVQGNIERYVDEYFRPISGAMWQVLRYNRQKHRLHFLPNGSCIYFASAEVPKNMEGFEYDLIILNEAGIILQKKGLWEHTILPMAKNAKVYLVGTPKGKTDQLYYALSQRAQTDPEWAEYHYSCYDSPFYTPAEIDRAKAQSAAHTWQQEYLAEFVDQYEHSLLGQDCLQYYDQRIPVDEFRQLHMHCDTTHTGKQTSDYFCAAIIGERESDKNYYLVDFCLAKLDVEEQARTVISLYQQYRRYIRRITFDAVSNDGFGYWTRKLAREEYDTSLPLEPVKYPADKVAHFTPHTVHFRSRRVYLPNWHPDISRAVDQLLAFPTKSVHDDFVDALSGCMDNLAKPYVPVTYNLPAAPPIWG